MDVTKLVGTTPQKKWAISIIESYTRKYPGITLPCNASADWWIKNRDKSIEELLITKYEIASPFTTRYPRYTREDALNTVTSLTHFVVVDTETTGLKARDEVIEISIVEYETRRVLMDTLLRPSDMSLIYEEEARDIHRIAEDELLIAPSFYSISKELENILTSYHVVAYNANFDVTVLQRMYRKHQLRIPVINATCAMRLFSAFIDTNDTISLANACSIMGIDQLSLGTPHRALNDVLSTCEIIRKIQEEV